MKSLSVALFFFCFSIVGIPSSAFASFNQAAQSCGIAWVERLIEEKKYDPNEMDRDNRTPLHYALTTSACNEIRSRIRLVKTLLKGGANPNLLYNKGSDTALLVASEKGLITMVRILLKNKADVNLPNIWKTTALHLASTQGHVKTVTELLKQGANVNAQQIDGETPLDWAIVTDETKEILRKNGGLRMAELSSDSSPI